MNPKENAGENEDWYVNEVKELVADGAFVCYECKDGSHCDCLGVPCMCPCPIQYPQTKNEIEYCI